AYGNSTKIVVSIPALNFSKELDLETDGVLIKNDDMLNGLNSVITRYNSLIIENEITMYVNNFNSRIQTLLSADDDNTRESAENYLEKIKSGDLGVIGSNPVFEGLKTHNSKQQAQNSITQLIELNQYLKAGLYNELGLNANFNMKRERLNTSEVSMNTDILKPFLDNMLDNRRESVRSVNEKYGLEISVEFGSIWNVPEPEPEEIEPEETETPEENENLILNISAKNIELHTELENEETDEQTDNDIDDIEPDDETDDEPDDEGEDDEV